MTTHDIDTELPPLPEARIVSYQTDSTMRRMELRTHSDEDMRAYARAAIEPYAKRIAQLEAARFAYASEFPPNEDGDPDVGSIHENIRKLKAELEADRQGRGGPVFAWYDPTTGLFTRNKDDPDSGIPAGSCLWPLYREAPTLHNSDSGAPNADQAPQPAEPVAWLRNERGEYAGKEVFDPLVILGSEPPIKTANGATYSPVFAAPQPAEPDYKQLFEQMCERCDALDAKLAEYSEREPVGYIMPTALKQLKAGGHAVVGGVSQGFDVPIFTAPQPTESCASLISDKPVCGSENGDCDSQPAEPVKDGTPLGKALDGINSYFASKKADDPVKVPSSFPSGTNYSVEPHGNGYAIYQGRDKLHHGANLAHLTECTPEFSKRIESALNAMSEPVKVPSDDVLTDALNNLEHDNYEQSYSGYKNRQADVELIRAALAAMGEIGREVEK